MSSGKCDVIEKRRLTAPRTGTSGLLRNMSCAPRARIQHRSPYRRQSGRGVVFAIPAGLDLLAQLWGTPGPGGPPSDPVENAEGALRDRMDAHARTLPFPAAALVTGRAEPEDEHCRDLLSVATVPARSSDRVYPRDKVPNLNQIRPGRRAVLIVPEGRPRR